MFERAKYKEDSKTDWTQIPDPVATVKRDGGHYFMNVEHDGALRFFSRRQSVKGNFPERTVQLPQLTDKKLPKFAGQTFSVELIHTGTNPKGLESNIRLTGILNSLPAKSIATQELTGPVRAVLLDVINPGLTTYKDKLLHMKQVQESFKKPDLLFVQDPVIGIKNISRLIESTKKHGQEGVIITSLNTPESKNPRIKIVHKGHLNLVITKIIPEISMAGQVKDRMGAVEVADRTGRIVATLGGFSAADKEDAFKNPKNWIGRLIQVRSRGLTGPGGRLRNPVYGGAADGDIDVAE